MFLKNIRVDFISLVRKGANKKTILWKSGEEDPPRSWDVPITKTDDEKRLIYGVVYSPGEVDSQGDHTDEAQIEKAAHLFMKGSRTGQGVDKQHSFQAEDGVFVAESWIVKDSDPVFPDEPEGSWAVAIKVEDDELWSAVKKGDIGGLSMGGVADQIQKAVDFNGAQAVDGFWQYFGALERSIKSILEDETVEDKKSAISGSIDQFKDTVVNSIEKGRDGGVLAKIKRLIKGEGMDEKQVKKIAKEAVDEALKGSEKPLVKEDIVEIVTEAIKGVIAPINDRLAKMEKQTPGSGQDDDSNLDDDVDHAAIGAEIAKSVTEG